MSGRSALPFCVIFLLLALYYGGKAQPSPNILICIADDVSFPHMGEICKWIDTPAFDRVAGEGLLFTNAYTPNAKCSPSRSCILTGRNSWQLKEAANHWNNFPPEFKTFPEVLYENGYHVGYTGKGWGPGTAKTRDGKKRDLLCNEWNSATLSPPTKGIANIDYTENFKEFFKHKAKGQPFFFWYGAKEPHRRYEYGSAIKIGGKKVDDIDQIPPFFPDNDIVRTDLLDYSFEIEYFDHHALQILEFLDKVGELDNTIIIVTSDNGMPFPRAKSDAYDFSNHLPMAIMWKDGIKHPGRVINDYVSFIDLAPTFLDVAGIEWGKSGMQTTPGKSLCPIFQDQLQQPFNDYILIGKERHDVGRPENYGYPIRGIIKDQWLYLVNYRNDLWPAGNPQTGYLTVDGSPTKTEVLQSRHCDDHEYLWRWSFGKRENEELFNLQTDPYCIRNLAADKQFADVRSGLKQTMENGLKEQGDPRMEGNGDIFHQYEFTWEPYKDAYERMIINKEKLVPIWINKTDIEPDFKEY